MEQNPTIWHQWRTFMESTANILISGHCLETFPTLPLPAWDAGEKISSCLEVYQLCLPRKSEAFESWKHYSGLYTIYTSTAEYSRESHHRKYFFSKARPS